MKQLLLTLVTLGIAQTGIAADLVHRPEYQAGQVHTTEAEVSVAQTLTINGADIVTSADTFLITSEVVEAATTEGATLRGGFETIQVDMMIAGTAYSFSSENPTATTPPAGLEPIGELYRGMAEAEWTTTVDENGRIESMEYVGDAFANLDPALQSEVDLQRHVDDANQQAERLPGEGIEIGQTWKRTEVMNLGSGQEFRIEREFTYAGSEDVNGHTLERVDVSSLSLEYTIAPNPSLPLTVKSSDLEIETTEGAFWYDPELGVIVKSNEEFHVTGDLELEIQGMVLPSQLELTITSAIDSHRE